MPFFAYNQITQYSILEHQEWKKNAIILFWL